MGETINADVVPASRRDGLAPPPHLQHRFDTLDALRGVAAILVMLFHYFGESVVPHGYMAVDFFFLLSGFVVTFAYQRKLDAGWGSRSFLLTRLIRLYPLYLLGLFLGLVIVLGHRHAEAPANALVMIVLFGLALVPLPHDWLLLGTAAFPLDLPAWSLSGEAIANIYHALFLRRRSNMVVAGLVIAFGLGFLYAVMRLGMVGFGSNSATASWGLIRVGFSYTFGVLLYLLWRAGHLRTLRFPALLSVALLVVLLAVPIRGIFWDGALAMCFFPTLLIASANAHVPAAFERPCKVLADASYAIYILHLPLSGLITRVLTRAAHAHGSVPRWEPAVNVLLTMVLAIFADRALDVPLRRRLRKRLGGLMRRDSSWG